MYNILVLFFDTKLLYVVKYSLLSKFINAYHRYYYQVSKEVLEIVASLVYQDSLENKAKEAKEVNLYLVGVHDIFFLHWILAKIG